MPVIRKSSNAFRDKLPTPIRTLADMFFPSDELPMDTVAAPMMIAGRAAKGLVNGIKGFTLPDGKIAKPFADGVNRIVEGDDAVRALAKMKESTSKELSRLPMPPSVSHPTHLPDVAVPIQDSLDTNMAAGAKSIGKWQNGRSNGGRKAKANETIVRDMRDLYDNKGWTLNDINRRYKEFSQPAVLEIVKRHTWAKVK